MPGYDRGAASTLRARQAFQRANTDTPFILGPGFSYSTSLNQLDIQLAPIPGLATDSDGLTVLIDPVSGNVLSMSADGLSVTGVVLIAGIQSITGLKTFTSTLTVSADLKIGTAGKGLYIKEGTNATMGTGVLTAGTVTVSTTKVTATSRIVTARQAAGGTLGHLSIANVVAGTSFDILSSSNLDTSTVAWILVEPA